MSTKGTRSQSGSNPFAGITPAPFAGKRAGSFSYRQLARDTARVSRQIAALQQCLRNQRKNSGLSGPGEARQVSRRLRAHQGRHAVSVGHGPRLLPPCEQACNRGKYDEAISIRAVERFLGDLGQALKHDVVKAGTPNGKKVAVVGSGPAGHSAAYQLARLGYKVTIFEKSPKAGGLNRGGIPDWVLPQDVLDREIERLLELGITIKTNAEVGKDISWDDLKKNYDACVLAVGLIDPNSVRAEGENKEGVLYGLPFLRDIGMGTSKVKLGARVAVIGGGNTAIDCAREALRQGAVEVTMITVEAQP